jgi:hypothetical protein
MSVMHCSKDDFISPKLAKKLKLQMMDYLAVARSDDGNVVVTAVCSLN